MPDITITITDFTKGRTRLKKTLDELPAITLDELQELFRLDNLIATNGGSCPVDVGIDRPVYVDCFEIYRPSIASMMFISEYACDWFLDDVECLIFTAMALQESRNQKKLFQKLGNKKRAIQAVKEQKKYICCTIEELKHAINSAYEGFPLTGVVDNESPAYLLALASNYSESIGGTPEYWFWDESAQRVMWMERERRDTERQENKLPAIGKGCAISLYLKYAKELKEKYVN